jgi:hypothetical protein
MLNAHIVQAKLMMERRIHQLEQDVCHHEARKA